jgi:hypothetical protein
MKRCSCCKIEKPVTEFGNDSHRPDGFRSECRQCNSKHRREYYAKNGDRCRSLTREWRKRNPAKLKEYDKRHRGAYYQRNKPAFKFRAANNSLKRKYSLTFEEKAKRLATQQGACALCHKTLSIERARVDHVHGSDPVIIRGILCDSCNWGLGHFRDNPDRLRDAARYVESFHLSKIFKPVTPSTEA